MSALKSNLKVISKLVITIMSANLDVTDHEGMNSG